MDLSELALPAYGERPSLRGQVTQALRAALVAGRMRPGVLYSAPALAVEFGVSATPVREAMLDLVKEGLVETVPNKGFRVTELSARELDELTELRELIEIPTVTRIAQDCDHGAIEALRPTARAIVLAADRGELLGYVEADRRFHLELLALAGNQQLVRVVDDLRARARLYGLHALAETGKLVESAYEHEQLLDLLRGHDVPGVERLMRLHLGHVRGQWAGQTEPEPAL